MKELVNAFAGNPLPAEKRSHVNPQALRDLLANEAVEARGGARVLPVLDGKPLVISSRSPGSAGGPVGRDGKGSASWTLAWQPLRDFGNRIPITVSTITGKEHSQQQEEEGVNGGEYDKLVYLGEKDGIPFFAIDVSSSSSSLSGSGQVSGQGGERVKPESLAALFSTDLDKSNNDSKVCSFEDLRTIMTAADWENKLAMQELSIAGHARAITEWHKLSQFCGRCGTKTLPIEAGERRECSNPACKLKAYPRLDPVVIMLVIDKERDRVVLARQARFAARMWSCLAGFLEAGESLEEAVRRETFEEVGLRVGEIVYHSSQPWPVGRPGMPSQLMVGFFAYAETFDIRVDGEELQDAQWNSRDQVRQALTFTDYRNQQEGTALQIWQKASGQREKNASEMPNVQGFPVAFVPGPYAIAHHLIATWANLGPGVALSKV